MRIIPYAGEQTSRGERSYDIFSRLLSDRILFLGEEVTDASAGTIIAQLPFPKHGCAEYEMRRAAIPALFLRYLVLLAKENQTVLNEIEFLKRENRNCPNCHLGWGNRLGEDPDGKCIDFFTGGRAMDITRTAHCFLLRASGSQKGQR